MAPESSEAASPLVSVIITSRDGLEYIPACLDSVFAQSYQKIEVILVDNASTDGSLEFVSKNYPQVRAMRSETNRGYGGGNNLGASIANGEHLLFLNHDTIVTKGFLAELVRGISSDPTIGIAQSKILMAADPGIVESVGAYLTMAGIWIHPHRGDREDVVDPEPKDILGACGTCMLVRSRLFKQLGGFDSDFIVYYDDADLSWRARLLGFRAVNVPSSVIHHWGGGTTELLPSIFTVYHSFKNRLCSLIKLLSPLDLLLVLPLHVSLSIGGALAYFFKRKPSNGIAVLRAMVWNARNLGATIEKRRLVQQTLSGDQRSKYGGLVRPFPLKYFISTSLGYMTKW